MQPQAEPARADESKLLGILAAVQVRLYAVDSRLRLTRADGPLDPFTGVSSGEDAPPADFLGRSLLSYLAEPERGRWSRVARKVLEGAELTPDEAMIALRMDSRLVRVAAEPLRDRSGAVTGVLFVSREVSADALKQLGTAVRRRQRRADRLAVARQLAVTLNHEINNPLFVVSATLEDMLAEADDPGLTRRLRAALDAVWKVAEAVRQLQEIRQIVSKNYIAGFTMIDLEASSKPPVDIPE